jgi:LysM repeat protein
MGIGWRHCLFMLTAITLTGCFQQAGDSLQSTGNTAVPIQQIDVSPTVAVASPTPLTLATAGPGTATLPPITIIVPPTDAPNAAEPTATPGAQGAATDTTSGFITPGSPLGPSIDTETPSGEVTTTPSGLITPTSLFEDNESLTFSSECTYTVQRGDTVYRIAVANNTSVDAMRVANPDLVGENPVIQPGQVLNLPDCGEETGAGPIDDLIESTSTNIPPIITPAGGAPATVAPLGGQVYVVERGDTLFSIGQRFGVTVAEIVAANDLLDPDRLNVGDELIIPQPAGNG